MGNNGWLEGLAAVFTIIGGAIAIAELVAPRCPTCGAKLVIINNNYFCDKCQIYVSRRTR